MKSADKRFSVGRETRRPFRSPCSLPKTRSRISLAALLVKVIATISCGGTPLAIRAFSRPVRAFVFPEPAPAAISSGPPGWFTAFSCAGFKLDIVELEELIWMARIKKSIPDDSQNRLKDSPAKGVNLTGFEILCERREVLV